MRQAHDIIKEFCVSEKAADMSANLNKYTFEVNKDANRIEIAHAIQKLFSVKVTRVNIFNKRGKWRRSRTRRGQGGSTPNVKRAIVTLAQGDKIELV